jgi:CRISPR-associated protein Cas1
MVAGKIHNSRQVLLRAARDTTGPRQQRLRTAAERHAHCLSQTRHAPDIDVLMGTEGTAARDYFAVVPHLCPSAPAPFERSRRPPADPLNSLLSFLCGMLRVAVHGALEQAGLDPDIGFLHGIRPGKPALALDLMEEFRPLIVDSVVLSLLNNGAIQQKHFIEEFGAYRLTDYGRRTFLTKLEARFDETITHPTFNYKATYRRCLELQTRLLAKKLMDEIPAYPPFTVR